MYDCGTYYDKDKKLLNKKICTCFSEDTIDALFISHFHKDHISGIPELIKKYTIKLVFLPFFTKEELILLRKKYGWEVGDDLYDFYTDPVEYFGGRVERIMITQMITISVHQNTMKDLLTVTKKTAFI